MKNKFIKELEKEYPGHTFEFKAAVNLKSRFKNLVNGKSHIKKTLVVDGHELKFSWNPEIKQLLKELHGVSWEKELEEIMREQVAEHINSSSLP
jgi:hypothetical protein